MRAKSDGRTCHDQGARRLDPDGAEGADRKIPEEIRKAMIDAHVPLIEKAGGEGVQILCFQEVFTQPYFCPEPGSKWYAAAERIPDGPTVKLMQDFAKKYQMVIVVPIYEEAMTGVYYNTAAVIDADGSYLGKYRKTHIPQVAGFWEKFFFKPGASEFPVFKTRYCRLGVYICYDRHFPGRAGAPSRSTARNTSSTRRRPSPGLSEYLWKLEQPGLRRRQRRLYRRHQPRRQGSAVEHRRVLRPELISSTRAARSRRSPAATRTS
jgi:N-carbamoylputrescine amidase